MAVQTRHCVDLSSHMNPLYLMVTDSATHPLPLFSGGSGDKGGIYTSAGWQVTLCNPIWHVSFP